VTNFVYFQFINPGFTDVIIQAQLAKMEAKGMQGAQLEQAEKVVRMMMKPGIQPCLDFARDDHRHPHLAHHRGFSQAPRP